MSQKYNSEYVNENEAFFIGRNDIINRLGNINSHYSILPGIIGYWNMANVQRSTGNVPNYIQEYTGATKQDLVYNGNPVFNYTSTGVPYIDMDGTGDYLSIADNTDLRITGLEAFNANPGITMYVWAWFDSVAGATPGIIGKWDSASNQRAYALSLNSGVITFFTSTNGTTTGTFSSGVTPSTGQWYHIVARFITATERAIFINGVKYSTTSSPPASIFAGTAPFHIGNLNGVLHNGNITCGCLCHNAHSDGQIQSNFQQTRSLFGV